MMDKAKNLATLILTSSDRITKQMRQDAFDFLEEVRVAETADMVTIDIGYGKMVTIKRSDEARYRQLCADGLVIQSIKQAREDYKIALKEAKDLIDAIRATLPRG